LGPMSSTKTIEQAEHFPIPEDAKRVAAPAAAGRTDVRPPDEKRPRERFLPITVSALMDRLTHDTAWPVGGQAAEARRFFRYLDYWREQQYDAKLVELDHAYEPFNPDSDLLITRTFSEAECKVLQKRVVGHVKDLLRQANYEPIDTTNIEKIITKETHYGLDLWVDFDVFEELLIYYRGASNRREQRRSWRKFLRKEEFEVPIFRRLFVLFKVRTEADHIRKVMIAQKIEHREAERIVKRSRSLLSESIKPGNIYMKLFKNMPRADVEMAFPNTRVKFRLFDKIKLGATAGGGLGYGAFSAAGKIALISANPVAAAGALVALGGIAFRQAVSFMNQRQRYMVVLAQNLYFHSMADNHAAMVTLAVRAAEQDVKEEMLLYSVLAKAPAYRSQLKAVDDAIEEYLHKSFDLHVNFDINDALGRLLHDGIVTEDSTGMLRALPPREAADHLDRQWDVFLDNLSDIGPAEGTEIEDADAQADGLAAAAPTAS
ncbi:MAG: DUF3754 domain-containing protein, partial [Hyphomicrobiaceae bacterium]